MSYKNAFSVDDLVDEKHKFVGKIVVVNALLVSYDIGIGFFRKPIILTIQGVKWKIQVHNEVSSFVHHEDDELKLYFDAFLGKEIGIKIHANTRTITSMKFGENEYNFL